MLSRWLLDLSSQALSDAELERSVVQEKLMSVDRELSAAVAEHSREKREMIARLDQQAQRIDALQTELSNAQLHLEHAKYALTVSLPTVNYYTTTAV